jgi:hypothetical protein
MSIAPQTQECDDDDVSNLSADDQAKLEKILTPLNSVRRLCMVLVITSVPWAIGWLLFVTCYKYYKYDCNMVFAILVSTPWVFFVFVKDCEHECGGLRLYAIYGSAVVHETSVRASLRKQRRMMIGQGCAVYYAVTITTAAIVLALNFNNWWIGVLLAITVGITPGFVVFNCMRHFIAQGRTRCSRILVDTAMAIPRAANDVV